MRVGPLLLGGLAFVASSSLATVTQLPLDSRLQLPDSNINSRIGWSFEFSCTRIYLTAVVDENVERDAFHMFNSMNHLLREWVRQQVFS